MSATISDLHIALKAKATGLNGPFRQAEHRAQSLGRRLKSSVGEKTQGMFTAMSSKAGALGNTLSQLASKGGAWGAAIAAVALATVGAVAATVKFSQAMLRVGAEVDATIKKARDLNLTFAELRGAELFSAEAGIEDAGAALESFNKRVGEFLQLGTGEGAELFKKLNIGAEELRRNDLFGQIDLFARGLKESGASAQETASAFDKMFGDASVARLFDDGTDKAREMVAEVERMGALNAEQARSIEQMNDAWGRVGLMVKQIWEQTTARFAPILQGVAILVQEILQGFIDVGKEVGESRAFETWRDGVLSVLDIVRMELVPGMFQAFAELAKMVNFFARTFEKTFGAAAKAARFVGLDDKALAAGRETFKSIADSSKSAADSMERSARAQANVKSLAEIINKRQEEEIAGVLPTGGMGIGDGGLGSLLPKPQPPEAFRAAGPVRRELPQALARGSQAALSKINELRGRQPDRVKVENKNANVRAAKALERLEATLPLALNVDETQPFPIPGG